MTGHMPDPRLPARACGPAAAGISPSSSESVDPLSGEPQERGQQGDRGSHHDEHHHRDGDPAGRHERHPGDGQAEDRDHHDPAGEHHRLAGRRDGTTDRLLDRQAGREILAIPGHHEQGVVDPHSQTDHAAQHRSPGRDLDQMGDQRHRADPDREAEDRHPDRQAHRDQRSERQHQDHDCGGQPEHLAETGVCRFEGEEQVAAQLDPQHLPTGPRTELFEVGQVLRAELGLGRILHPDQRDPTVTRDHPTVDRRLPSLRQHTRRVTTAEHVRQRSDPALHRAQSDLRGGRVEERRAAIDRGDHDLGGEPGLTGSGSGQQIGGLLAVQPGHLDRVDQLGTEGAGRSDHQHGQHQPRADHDPGATGREPTHPVQDLRHHVVAPSRACTESGAAGPISATAGMWFIVARDRSGHIGPEGLRLPGRSVG